MDSFKKISLLVVLLFLSAYNCFAQTEHKIDSIIKAKRLNIYKDPEEATRIGDSIYSSPQSSNYDKVRGLLLLSSAYSSKRDYQKALKYCLKSDSIAKKENNQDINANIANSIAIVYQQLKVYDKALEYIDKCEGILGKYEIRDSVYLRATNFAVRGLIYKEGFSCELAIPFLDKSISYYKRLNTKNEQPNLSIMYYNKGYCYYTMGKYKEAKTSFEEAVLYAEFINAKSLKAFALKGLAEVYTHEENYSEAIKVLEEALTLSKDVGDLILNRGVYMALADNYLSVNNWEKYQEYRKLFLRNQDIIKESERRSISDSIDGLMVEYDTKTSQLTNRYYIYLSVIIILILIALFVIYRYHNQAKKSLNKLRLELQKVKKSRKLTNLP
ncbi:tetratricopeptide repeat protein [Flavobacterium alkalisoli]|uniref:tetratricopeptide repeat protein n=1 Tax=Flavobacterium alkalisoli TaxID=2602769 RepID=UPI003A8D718A